MTPTSPNLRLIDRNVPSDEQAVTDANFKALFKTHVPYVAGIALRLLGRDAEIDDVIQDVFFAAHRGMKQVRDAGSLRGWLATVTVRTAYRRLRRRKWWAAIGLDTNADVYEQLGPPEMPPERRAQLQRVYQVLDSLPAKERLAWSLRYLQGESIEATATLCGCSLATVHRRIAAAHAKIKMEVVHG